MLPTAAAKKTGIVDFSSTKPTMPSSQHLNNLQGEREQKGNWETRKHGGAEVLRSQGKETHAGKGQEEYGEIKLLADFTCLV